MPVDDQGMIKLTDNLRVLFTYMVQKMAKDGKVPLTIVRAGKEMQIQLPVSQPTSASHSGFGEQLSVLFHLRPGRVFRGHQNFVRYLIDGPDSKRWTSSLSYTGSPLLDRINDKPAFEGEHLVVVSSPFFPHALAKGYSQPYYQVVKCIIGITDQKSQPSGAGLARLKDEFVTIAFDSRLGETCVSAQGNVRRHRRHPHRQRHPQPGIARHDGGLERQSRTVSRTINLGSADVSRDIATPCVPSCNLQPWIGRFFPKPLK